MTVPDAAPREHSRPPARVRLARTAGVVRAHAGQLALKAVGSLWPPNALLIARHGAGLLRPGPGSARHADIDPAIEAAIGWLCRSQDRVGSGGVGCYEFYGWTTGYPEVTGYIIPTMWDSQRMLGRPDLGERAVRMADWELRVQRPEGGFEGGYEGDGNPPVVFNTGQVIRGLQRTAEETGERAYLDAAIRAATWIADNQDDDGSWTRANYKGMKRVYDSYVSAPLARLATAAGEERFAQAARRNGEFVLGRQRGNGWFELCDNNPRYNDAPLTHTICYTVDGLLETGEALGDERLVAAAVRAADAMLAIVEESPRLPARLGEAWQPRAKYVCVTGAAQLGVILLKIHARTGEERYLEGARSLAGFLVRVQRMSGVGPDRRGALPGSFPAWGFYAPLKLPSWAAKYHLDLLLGLRAVGNAAENGPRQVAGTF